MEPWLVAGLLLTTEVTAVEAAKKWKPPRLSGHRSITGGNIMAKRAIKHWEDPVNLALGLWLLVSPWVLRYAAGRDLMWSAIVLGALITAVAVVALYRVAAWQAWANMVLGLCAIVVPWIPEGSPATATLNSVIIGGLVAALATLTLAADRHIGGWRSPAT